jgi:hypothetical protein
MRYHMEDRNRADIEVVREVVLLAIFTVSLGVYVVALLLCIYANTADYCHTCDQINERVLSLAERFLVLVASIFLG